MSDEPKSDSKPCCGPVKIAAGFAIIWALVVGAIWIGTSGIDEEWSLAIFIGRFHLLAVHVPIGLLLIALVVEFARGIRPLRSLSDNVAPMLWFGALGAAASTVLGFCLMVGEQEAGENMDWHFWTGLIVTVLAFVVLVLKIAKAPRPLYLGLLTITVGLVGYSAHLGGSLVHGEDFLAEHAPEVLKPLLGGKLPEDEVKIPIEELNVGELVLYTDVIQPIFDEKCIQCHGLEKVKGKMRMDSFEELAKGGEIGESFVAGDPEKSELVYRVTEADEEEIMPPGKDDVPMTESEIAILVLWIEKGASPTMKVAEAEPTPELLEAITAIVVGEPEPVEEPIVPWASLSPKEQTERLAEAQTAAEEIGFSLLQLSAEDDRLRLSVINSAEEFGDEQLLRLAPVESHLAWVDLGGSKITDEGMKLIGRMVELERLHLENTAVTDSGLGRLSRLENLNYLNLYGTEITDLGLDALQGLPKLRKLYLWQTKVTPQGKRDFERAVNLEINIGSDGDDEEESPAEDPAAEAQPPK
ncbi:MAG: putative membrane protein [Verrucomicrobiales bacterium]|jgi:uncharacterized membrane protein